MVDLVITPFTFSPGGLYSIHAHGRVPGNGHLGRFFRQPVSRTSIVNWRASGAPSREDSPMTFSNNRSVHGLGLVGVLCCGLAQAAPINDAIKLRAGTFACGGNHFVRVDDTEQHRSVYVISNPNPEITVALDRVRVFDANGRVIFDYPSDDDLPASVKPELGPYETTQINSSDILTEELTAQERPMQTHIEWSNLGSRRGLAPSVGLVRTVRNVSGGAERSRASAECRLIGFER
jgi:hypothetical protein